MGEHMDTLLKKLAGDDWWLQHAVYLLVYLHSKIEDLLKECGTCRFIIDRSELNFMLSQFPGYRDDRYMVPEEARVLKETYTTPSVFKEHIVTLAERLDAELVRRGEIHPTVWQAKVRLRSWIVVAQAIQGLFSEGSNHMSFEIREPEPGILEAPVDGAFYCSSEPGLPPFVQEGDVVEVSAVLCVIECSKVFNEIPADMCGDIPKGMMIRIVEILVKNEDLVKAGQRIFRVEFVEPET